MQIPQSAFYVPDTSAPALLPDTPVTGISGQEGGRAPGQAGQEEEMVLGVAEGVESGSGHGESEYCSHIGSRYHLLR